MYFLDLTLPSLAENLALDEALLLDAEAGGPEGLGVGLSPARHLLHHGTLLHGFDFTPIARYLKLPPRQPEYRRQRPHTEFLTNLPVARLTLEQVFRESWDANEALPKWPEAKVKQLVEERYSHD